MVDRERTPLLTERGRLSDPCWAVDDIFVYNKENMRPALRRREWESYQLFNEHFALGVYYGHGPGGGRAGATLVDFDTEERITAGKRKLFCGDSYDLDFSCGEPHTLKFEDKGVYLSIGYDGSARRVSVRTERIDARLDIPDAGEAMVTACPYARRTGFLYQYKKVFPAFSGHVRMNKLAYPLSEGTVLALSSGRGVLPYLNSSIWAVGGQRTECGYLALNLGEDYGPDGAPTENALFVDGVMDKLGKVSFKFRQENLMKPWRIADGRGRLHLEFTPEFDNYERTNLLAVDIRRHQFFGKLSGSVKLADGRVIGIDGARFLIERIDERR